MFLKIVYFLEIFNGYLNISAFLLMNFSAHTKVPDRYERWWVTAVTPCPRMLVGVHLMGFTKAKAEL